MDLMRKILGSSTRSGPLAYGRIAFLLVILSLWLLRSPKLANRVAGISFLFIAGVLAWLGDTVPIQVHPSRASWQVYFVAAALGLAALLSFAALPQGVIAAFRHALVVVSRAVLGR